ncbi:hypothetical protein LOTGIDRAFT_173707 [Lottia gigantea]|uniref:Uncharacterized protein n=1 Tax=Lottia gigantea TaxID=225164 RepID=V4AWY3_LOTGI|nr:hypothetical protein LOTGIDRAFT_173707 [Lottia gigantea]ESO99565.1 hypothetical protein LOTGIDRAFT_173707 [Lottia gigantea]
MNLKIPDKPATIPVTDFETAPELDPVMVESVPDDGDDEQIYHAQSQESKGEEKDLENTTIEGKGSNLSDDTSSESEDSESGMDTDISTVTKEEEEGFKVVESGMETDASTIQKRAREDD